ncbi:MAG: protein kinase [Planctomycetes bacterium]|nr:protein kinase [Planctomycetota bacterium]
MAKLVVRKGRNVGAEFKLNADRLIMGRRSQCPIPVLDPKASREHAVITRKDGNFFLQDLSRNGTYLNSQGASKNGEEPSPLKFGDKIRIGDTIMEMVDEKAEVIDIQIPGYKILEKIGIGGMGTVYKAKQLSMDRIVALKVLNEKYSNDREFVDRFVREARAAGKLNHPNVIHVHDVSKAGGRHYFSMEYIDGNSVKEELRIHGKIGTDKALDIMLQTAKALEFAHENGIVHRDIKPDNIMLTNDGVVKIADLGIAKTFEEVPRSPNDNRRVMGTPHYMAPEQALGKDIDHRVDIYSLGATFYHTLTGTTPFSGSTAHEVLKAHIQESLPAIQTVNKGVPDPVCFIVERMMAKLPEKRYPNVTRLIEDLERVQQGIHDGIEQIPAGDSTVMRAVDARGAAEKAKAAAEGVVEELTTGLQQPVKNALLYAGLVGVFLLVVVLVVVIAPKFMGGGGGSGNGANPGPGEVKTSGGTAETPPAAKTESGEPVVAVKNDGAEAEKMLADAAALLKDDPVSSAAGQILQDVVKKFPALPARDKANEMLKGIAAERRARERQVAKKAFDDAAQFEAANQSDASKWPEIAARFQAVLASAQNVQDIYDQAKGKAEDWKKKHEGAVKETEQADLAKALAAVDTALAAKDFDAARQTLKDFIGNHAAGAAKDAADARLKEVDAAAAKAFEAAKADADSKAKGIATPLPDTLAVWKGYLAAVKDAVHRGQAETAQKAVEEEAAKLFADESAKTAELAKSYQYADALQRFRRLRKQLGSMGVAAGTEAREKDLLAEENLHERVLEAIRAKTAGGAVALPFEYVDEKYKNIEALSKIKTWAVTKVDEGQLELDAIPKNSAPGMRRKFDVFTPKQQYQLHLHFLPPATPADHLAYAAFCKELGLNEEAALHEAKAKGE